jgi:hypothetical protein
VGSWWLSQHDGKNAKITSESNLAFLLSFKGYGPNDFNVILQNWIMKDSCKVSE